MSSANPMQPIKFTIPDGTTCSGVIDGISNVCFVKIANPSTAGPFGGVVAVQIVEGTKRKRVAAGFRA
jgi:hypothetical protein